ncbi:MAG: hypothetical protein NTV86_21065, partial [Planctomycetota bacterium]|nr:hypothetical protein [Planctomycetota bacterium]
MRRKQTAMLAAFVAAGVGLGVLAVLRGQETAPAGGAEKTPATQPAQPLVQRVYDIGELVAPTRDSTHANALLPVTEINESV